jgi:ribonuclease BN (tRNA processing enzyme)
MMSGVKGNGNLPPPQSWEGDKVAAAPLPFSVKEREETRMELAPIFRRDFMRSAAGLAGAAMATEGALAQAGPALRAAGRRGTRLILLGTKGGPRPTPQTRGNPAQVILVNDVPYVIDCGSGVADKLVLAQIPLPSLRHIFLTHHHSDHNADYGNLVFLAWASGLKTRVDAWGPPPLARMTKLFWELNEFDVETRIPDEGRPDPRPLLVANEFDKPGLIMEDENVRVTAARVNHKPIVEAYAYRFDTPDRSIVISGDTAPTDALVELAKGADVLVHEALYVPALEKLLARNPNAARLRDHIIASHTVTEDVGRVAAAAGVKLLVLSHLVPGDDWAVTDELWMEGPRQHFSGRIVVARDLMEI